MITPARYHEETLATHHNAGESRYHKKHFTALSFSRTHIRDVLTCQLRLFQCNRTFVSFPRRSCLPCLSVEQEVFHIYLMTERLPNKCSSRLHVQRHHSVQTIHVSVCPVRRQQWSPADETVRHTHTLLLQMSCTMLLCADVQFCHSVCG